MVILTETRLRQLKINKYVYNPKLLKALEIETGSGWWLRVQNKIITKEVFNEALKYVRPWKIWKKKKPKKKRFKPVKKKALTEHQKKYYAYLESKEWAEIRADLFMNRGRKCEYCGHKSGLQVHHLHYRNIFKEEPEDLVILCASCHKAEHQ